MEHFFGSKLYFTHQTEGTDVDANAEEQPTHSKLDDQGPLDLDLLFGDEEHDESQIIQVAINNPVESNHAAFQHSIIEPVIIPQQTQIVPEIGIANASQYDKVFIVEDTGNLQFLTSLIMHNILFYNNKNHKFLALNPITPPSTERIENGMLSCIIFCT